MTEKILSDLDFKKTPLSNPCHISITLCTDRQIRTLNKQYRGKDKATDVLSFSMIEGEAQLKEYPILGDVVISLDTTIRQAKEYKVNPYQELLRLLIHGILHLAGYEHEGVSSKVAKTMKKEEDRLYFRLLSSSEGLIGR